MATSSTTIGRRSHAPPPEHGSSHAAVALAALALAMGVAAPSTVHAGGPGGGIATLGVRVADPPTLAYDATALGRATHSLHLVLTNNGPTAALLDPLVFRFRPMREGVTYPCDEARGEGDRWPPTLDPGASFTLMREVTCDTSLPGRYDVELLGRPRGAADASERTYGSFVMHIEAGANPPVKLPWDASLHAAASSTKELRPTKDPKAARIVVALVNGTRTTAPLSPLRAIVKVSRRGSTVAPCAEHGVDLAFGGALGPGRAQALSMPLGCELAAEAVYDVDVSVANAAGARVHLATHAIRVGLLPPPPPRPEDVQQGKVIGGM